MPMQTQPGRGGRCPRCQGPLIPRWAWLLLEVLAWLLAVAPFAFIGTFAPVCLVFLAPVLLAGGFPLGLLRTLADEGRCLRCGGRAR